MNQDPPKLRLLHGGDGAPFTFQGVRIALADEHHPPFPVDAIGVEEDTFLVLSADPVVRPPKEHFLRVFTELLETEPLPLGGVVASSGHPIKFLAVVHDLSASPSWREEWVQAALMAIVDEMESRRLSALGLQFLGSIYGQLSTSRFIDMLAQCLTETQPECLRRIWLIMDETLEWPDLTPLTTAREG